MKKRIISLTVFICMIAALCQGAFPVNTAEAADDLSWLLDIGGGNAYVTVGAATQSDGMTFLDGNNGSMKNYDGDYTSTDVTVGGVDARYFSSNSRFAVRFDDEFYQNGDKNYIISIVYYDYGPGQGKFYFDYNKTDGTTAQLTLIKPGKNPGWTVNTVVLEDMDASKTFEDGSSVRVVTSNGGKNAFKKIEAANIDKLIRENKSVKMSCIKGSNDAFLKQAGIIETDDTTYADSNMHKDVTPADAHYLLAAVSGGDKNAARRAHANDGTSMTQGELLRLFEESLGIVPGTSPLAAAKNAALIQTSDLFVTEDGPATYANAVNLAYRAFFYKRSSGTSFAHDMISGGYFSEETIHGISDVNFTVEYYSIPRSLPYKKIEDSETGRTYYYINMFGQAALRPYMTLQSWTEDANGFIVGSKSNGIYSLFVYDTVSQTVRYVDTNLITYGTDHIDACVGTDNSVYYVKNDDGGSLAIYKSDLTNIEPKKIIDIPKNVTVGGISLSNDNKYIGFDYKEPYTADKDYPEGSQLGARLNLETSEWDIFSHKWDFANLLNHTQINPVYTDLLFFCHEKAGTGYKGIVNDRIWTVDLTTGKQDHVIQGYEAGTPVIMPTHETWSLDGEYLYFVDCASDSNDAVAIVDKNGRHRQYFKNPYGYFYKHCFGSGDAKYIAADGHYMTIINTETYQAYKIARWKEDGKMEHPYHPHPHIARNAYKMSWGAEYEGVLGIMWYDFSEIDENEVAKGGREALSDDVTIVNYDGLDCEVSQLSKGGADCIATKNDTAIYAQISRDIADSTDCGVKITFDYYDEGRQPIVLTYTKGVKKDADYWKTFNAQKQIKRTNTKNWKTAEITIDSGNFEKVAKYASDFKIGGLKSQAYIKNIRVSAK